MTMRINYERTGFRKERRDFLKVLVAGSCGALLSGSRVNVARAAGPYPDERLTWICPIKGGGGYDLTARMIAPYLCKYLKETNKDARGGEVVVKNVPEAGGRRAYTMMQNAKPDGYTIGDFNPGFIAEAIASKSDINFAKFTYLVRLGVEHRLIVALKNSFKSWDAMMKAGKLKELRWAAASYGQGGHVTSILLKETAKVPARLVNFSGNAENVNALIRGDVQIATIGEAAAKAMVEAGELLILAVLADKSIYPGVPSLTDLGYPELADPCTTQRLVIGPPGISVQIRDAINVAFKRVFVDNEYLSMSQKTLGFTPEPLYGSDAERVAQGIANYYEAKKAILKKYLE